MASFGHVASDRGTPSGTTYLAVFGLAAAKTRLPIGMLEDRPASPMYARRSGIVEGCRKAEPDNTGGRGHDLDPPTSIDLEVLLDVWS